MAGEEPTTEAPKKREASDVYDRQIRLWGKEAQEKMAKARVLYIHMTGVSSEILKNLVLAGIPATICDNRPFPQAVSDTPSFLLPPSSTEEPATKKTKYETVGQALKPVVQELNLLLGECPVLEKDVSELDEATLSQFPIVVASRIGMDQAQRLAELVTKAGNKFYVADCFGMHGASAMDLGQHEYRPELGKKLLEPKPLEPYYSLHQIFATPLEQTINRFHKTAPPPAWIRYRAIVEYHRQTQEWPTAANADQFADLIQKWVQVTSPTLVDHELFQTEALKQLATIALAEVAPICAVLGGMLGNEVIKAISGKGEPANNTVLFDGDTCKCWTFLVKPKEEK